MHIEVLHLSEVEKQNLGIYSWPIVTIDKRLFAMHHEKKEECYLLEGEVEMTTADGAKTKFGAGDYVVIPEGFTCICNIRQTVRKHSHTES